jgi:site-specific DNA recombinase
VAIDRYLTAFENGTLDERACGHRIRDLAVKLDQLNARQDELAQLTDHTPNPPDPAAIAHLRRHLADVLTHGTPASARPSSKPTSPKSESTEPASSPSS